MTNKTQFTSLFANKAFLKLWISQALSLFVANLLNYALIVTVAEATGSSVAVGFLLFIYYLPTVFLGILAGALVDRLSKRKIIFWTCLLQAGIALLYAPFENKIWLLFIILFFYTLVDEFLRPAGDSLLPHYVDDTLLPYANSVSVISIQASSYVGYLLSGPLMSVLGNGYIYFTAFIFLVAAAFIAFLLPKEKPSPSSKKGLFKDFKSLTVEVEEAYRFIKTNVLVFYAILLNSAFFFVITTTVVLLPSLSRTVLNLNLRFAAPFYLLPAGLGFLATSFRINQLMGWLSKRGSVLVGMILVAISFLSLGVVPIFGHPVGFIIVPFIAFFCGMGAVLVIVPARIVVQQRTPFSTYGRVFGVIRTLMAIASAVPMLFAAVVADIFGLIPVFFLLGGAILISALIIDKKFRILDLNNLL